MLHFSVTKHKNSINVEICEWFSVYCDVLL